MESVKDDSFIKLFLETNSWNKEKYFQELRKIYNGWIETKNIFLPPKTSNDNVKKAKTTNVDDVEQRRSIFDDNTFCRFCNKC